MGLCGLNLSSRLVGGIPVEVLLGSHFQLCFPEAIDCKIANLNNIACLSHLKEL